MSRRRFYAPPAAFAPDGGSVGLSREETQHLRGVLRLKAGDEVFVFDGAGREFACVVGDSGGGRGGAGVLEVRGQVEPQRPESPLQLTLALALLKGEKFDLAVQKATELGVWRIVPVATKRADVRLRDERDAEMRLARWRRLALEAAKQSGRACVPEVTAPVAFASFMSGGMAAETSGPRLLFTECAGHGLLEGVREWSAGRPAAALALVGPEGGWETNEIEQARATGWRLITLGGRVLRAETAALVVAALLQHLWGDLK